MQIANFPFYWGYIWPWRDVKTNAQTSLCSRISAKAIWNFLKNSSVLYVVMLHAWMWCFLVTDRWSNWKDFFEKPFVEIFNMGLRAQRWSPTRPGKLGVTRWFTDGRGGANADVRLSAEIASHMFKSSLRSASMCSHGEWPKFRDSNLRNICDA